MFGGEVLAQFVTLLLEGNYLVVHLDEGLQHALGFEVEVQAATALAIAVVGGLGGIHFALEGGELSVEELEGILGFSRAALHILAHVGLEDVVEDDADLVLIPTSEADLKNPGLFATLLDGELLAHELDSGFGGAAHQHEAGAGPGYEVGNEDGELAGSGAGADGALEGRIAVFIEEFEAAVYSSGENQGLVFGDAGHIKSVDLQRLAAPGVAGQAEQRGVGFVTFVTTGDGGADDREGLGLDVNIQLKAIDHPAQHHAGSKDLLLGRHGGAVAQQGLEILEGGRHAAAALLFNLQQAIGLVDRLGHKQVGAAQQDGESGDGGDEPAVFHEHRDDFADGEALLFFGAGSYLLAGHGGLGFEGFVFHGRGCGLMWVWAGIVFGCRWGSCHGDYRGAAGVALGRRGG